MQVAAISTVYRHNSHAEMMIGRLLGEFPHYTPSIKVASLYLDQIPDNDAGVDAAGRHGVAVCETIRETIQHAVTHGGLDGVIIIGEHGNYSVDAMGRKRYPRKRLLEETLLALDELGVRVPIFSDKFLSWCVDESVWMYEQLKGRDIPFFGGSSIPHTAVRPEFDRQLLKGAREWLIVSFSNELEAYGYHALEVLQSLAERRDGGETGISSVSSLSGEAAWEALARREWPEDMLLQTLERSGIAVEPHPKNSEKQERTTVIVVEYRDGCKGYVVQRKEWTDRWSFSFRDATGEIVSAVCLSDNERPFGHFDTLTGLIERFIITRAEPVSPERILITSCLINRVMESLYKGVRVMTPELLVQYKSKGSLPC